MAGKGLLQARLEVVAQADAQKIVFFAPLYIAAQPFGKDAYSVRHLVFEGQVIAVKAASLVIAVPVEVRGLELVATAQGKGGGNIDRRLVVIHGITIPIQVVVILDILIGGSQIKLSVAFQLAATPMKERS